jgi:hypothetical protein
MFTKVFDIHLCFWKLAFTQSVFLFLSLGNCLVEIIKGALKGVVLQSIAKEKRE